MATWYMEVYMKCKGPHSIYSENWKSKQFVFIAKSNSEFLFLLPVQPRSTETEGNDPAVGCLVFRKPLDSCCVLPPEVTRERRPAKEKCAVVSPPIHTHTHTVSQLSSSQLRWTAVRHESISKSGPDSSFLTFASSDGRAVRGMSQKSNTVFGPQLRFWFLKN